MLLIGFILLQPFVAYSLEQLANFDDIGDAFDLPISNASCGLYFDKYCLVKDIENPYCLYRKYELDKEYEVLNLSPRLHKQCRTCGIVQLHEYEKVINKIYGGRESVPHSWPWIAGLYTTTKKEKEISQHLICSGVFCAASLISEKYAITATHCLLDSQKEKEIMEKQWYSIDGNLNFHIFLRFGDHQVNTPFFEPQVDVFVQRFMIYKSGLDRIDGDVVILELEKPVKFTPEIHPVCLPPPNLNLEPGTKCMTVGWGSLQIKPPMPAPSLHEVELTIVSPVRCLNHSRIFRMDMQVCVYQPNRGVLGGDSGGGLYCKIHKEDPQWYLYGITSYSFLSSGVNSFARVPYYVDWIHQNIK